MYTLFERMCKFIQRIHNPWAFVLWYPSSCEGRRGMERYRYCRSGGISAQFAPLENWLIKYQRKLALPQWEKWYEKIHGKKFSEKEVLQ